MQVSTVTMFLSKHFKVIAALSIPVVIGFIFVYAQEMAKQEVKKYQDEQKEHPTSEKVSVNDYQLKEVDDKNQVRWQLISKRGVIENNNQIVNLDDVQVDYFDGKDLKMRLIAPIGLANESTKYVKLSSSHGQKVQAIGQNGKATLSSDTVELTKKNQFLASGGVTIEWPQVAKVTGDTASGKIDMADFKNFKIAGNTHAEIVVK